MKILTAEQIREADEYTIKKEPIKSIDLMERAATRCFDWIYQNAPSLFPSSITEEKDWVFHVVCGTGNNGGDGLVIARLLQRNGYNVEISVVRLSEKGSKDFETNFDKLGKLKKSVVEIGKDSDLIDYPTDAVVIDAIFGTGLNRPVEGIAAKVVDRINQSGAAVISIDLPSGLFAGDNSKNNLDTVVRSKYLLSFQVPKLSFFLNETAEIIGEIHILDIGLHPDFLNSVKANYHLFTENEARAMHRKRPKFSHKGSFGHVLLIAGSKGKRGAAVLSAKASLKAGVGLVTLHCDEEGASILHNTVPEGMISFDEGKGKFTSLPKLEPYSAVVAGPGLGTAEDTARALKLLIQEAKVPLILDADALNILAENPTWMSFLPKGTILTPHPGEFARIAGGKFSHYENLEKQVELSRKHEIYILLKGAHSSLSLPDGQLIINSTGNPGMATAGTGDSLTGIIGALLASGYTSMEAAALGMYVHGLAGDLCLEKESQESLTASDLIDHLGKAFQKIVNEG